MTTAERHATASDALAYTFDAYRDVLTGLAERGYDFVGFDGDVGDGEVLLRHDVDLSLDRALEMARVEAGLGVRSTYYVLVTAPVYDVISPHGRHVLRQIADLGHDVGLHFNAHGRWTCAPADDVLAHHVDNERGVLERWVNGIVEPFSFHRPPDWALGRRFDGLTHTYQPRYFSDVAYVSDSNQKWRTDPPFPDGPPEAMQILVHPGLWGPEDRSLDAVFERTKREAYADVDAYVDPMGKWLHRR